MFVRFDVDSVHLLIEREREYVPFFSERSKRCPCLYAEIQIGNFKFYRFSDTQYILKYE